MIRWGALAYESHARLEKQGVQATARVTDARRERREGEGESFEIRYVFEPPGRPGSFTLGDETGREDLWATTDGQPEWERAQETGKVQVLYLPADPRVNRLLTRRGNRLRDPAAVVILGLMVVAVGALIGWLEATGRGSRWRRVVEQIRNPRRPVS